MRIILHSDIFVRKFLMPLGMITVARSLYFIIAMTASAMTRDKETKELKKDEDGNFVKTGDQGEIVVRGPVVFSGYWNLEEDKNTVVHLSGGGVVPFGFAIQRQWGKQFGQECDVEFALLHEKLYLKSHR